MGPMLGQRICIFNKISGDAEGKHFKHHHFRLTVCDFVLSPILWMSYLGSRMLNDTQSVDKNLGFLFPGQSFFLLSSLPSYNENVCSILSLQGIQMHIFSFQFLFHTVTIVCNNALPI